MFKKLSPTILPNTLLADFFVYFIRIKVPNCYTFKTFA